MLVIPAYIYNWKPIKEIVIFGELLAISAIIMCLLFVTSTSAGRTGSGTSFRRSGHLNFPRSILAWDVLVLNVYFVAELRRRHAHPLSRLPRAALQQAPGRSAGPALDSRWRSASTP